MVKNLPCSAGDTGSIPGQGTEIPYALEQQSPCTATGEPVHTTKIQHVAIKT